jgi:nicotinate-nucleotide adenylyltransferase
VGADTARTLGSWREPVRIFELAQLAVASRAGSSRQQVLDTVAGLRRTAAAHAEHTDAEGADATLAAGVRFLEMPAVEISSSMVRGRVARAEPVDALVGAAVAAYIAEHGLYHAVSQVPS